MKMLENPSEFNQSVEALLAAQKQAITSGSMAGGQHLCFMGSGIDDDDKYVNMVVSNFLQRKINFVSLALGGYEELKNSIEDVDMIVGTDMQTQRARFTEEWVKKINVNVCTLHTRQMGFLINTFIFLEFGCCPHSLPSQRPCSISSPMFSNSNRATLKTS
jgi:hypothetical protein